MTADGIIVTGAARDRVPRRFEPVLADAVTAVDALDQAASLYVYGSVATGQARPGQSDVDLLTVDVPAKATSALAAELTRRHRGVCRAVDIATTASADFGRPTDECYGNRVFLRHYCVHLTGPVQPVEPGGFAADARAARGFNGDIADRAVRWQDALRADANWAEVARTIARKTLLAVAGLVSVHDRTWTTDRATAAARWRNSSTALAAGSGGTGYSCSARSCSTARLVTSTCSWGAADSSAATTGAAATSCSKLSSSSSNCFGRRCAIKVSKSG